MDILIQEFNNAFIYIHFELINDTFNYSFSDVSIYLIVALLTLHREHLCDIILVHIKGPILCKIPFISVFLQ